MSTNDRRDSRIIKLISSKWQDLENIPVERTFAGAVAIDKNRLIVVGGEVGTKAISSGNVYDSTGQKWETLRNDMPTARWGFAVAATPNGKMLFVAGGRTSAKADTAALEALNTSTYEWEKLKPMENKLRGCTAVASQRFLYVFGGYKLNAISRRAKFVNYASRYNILTNKWQHVEPMPSFRGWSASAIVRGKVYVVGGHSDGLNSDPLDTIEIFDLKSGTWSASPPQMQTARTQCAVATIGTCLFVIGGKGNEGEKLSSIEVYNTADNLGKWIQFSLPLSTITPRFAFSAAVLGDARIVLLGGHGLTANSAQALTFPQLLAGTMELGVRGQSLFGDSETGEDLLGIEAHAKALADTISFKDLATPFVVGLLGGWGSGKSFTFNLIKKRLIEIQSHDLSIEKNRKDYPYVGHIYLVKFDAWTFGKGNLWASLMYTILVDLNDQLDLESILRGEQQTEAEDRPEEQESESEPKDLLRESVQSSTESIQQQKWNTLLQRVQQYLLWKFSKWWRRRETAKLDSPFKSKVKEGAMKESPNLLLRGVSVIELMDKLSDNDQAYFKKIIQQEGLPEKIGKYELKTGRITEALVKAVDDQSNEDKDELLQKQQELAWKYIECKNKIKTKGALYDLLADAYSNFKENNEAEVPKSIEDALDSFNWLEKKSRLFFSVDPSVWGWFFFLLALAGIVTSIVSLLFLPQFDELYKKLLATLIPLFTGFAAIVKKIQNTYNKLRPTFTRALENAHCEEDHVKSGEWIDLELQEDGSKEAPLRLKQLKVEIDALQERVWIKEGESLADVVKARVDTSDYEKELGVVHRAQTDLNRLSEALLSNKCGDNVSIFPRGDPRIVIFIDDLDRCPPRKVVETLEAVQLLVKTNLFVVVMAIDARFVTLSLEKEYSDILRPDRSPSGLDYLEKIIQLPYRIPPINRAEDMDSYLRGQMKISNALSADSEHVLQTIHEPISSTSEEPVPNHDTPEAVARPEAEIEAENDDVSELANPILIDDSIVEDELTMIPSKPINFTEEELQTMKLACLAAYVNPRAAKRLVNVFKLMKVIWYHRDGTDEVSKEVKDACLLLLAMCASKKKTMRLGMCEAFEKLENRTKIVCLGEFVVDTLGPSLDGCCKQMVEEMLVENVLKWETFEKEFWLVRSFSFVGEYATTIEDVDDSSSLQYYISHQDDTRSRATSYYTLPPESSHRTLPEKCGAYLGSPDLRPDSLQAAASSQDAFPLVEDRDTVSARVAGLRKRYTGTTVV